MYVDMAINVCFLKHPYKVLEGDDFQYSWHIFTQFLLKKAGKKLAGFVCKARQIHIIKSLIVSVFL